MPGFGSRAIGPWSNVSDQKRSIYRLRLRKGPSAIQDLRPRTIEAHRIVPAFHDRQAFGELAGATAELDIDGSVRALGRGDIVERVRVVIVLFVVSGGVVEADGPETIDRHVLDAELVDRGAVVLVWGDVQIRGVLVGIAAPARRGPDQVADRIDLLLGAEGLLEVRYRGAEHEKRIPDLLLARRVPTGDLEAAGTRLLDLDRILQGVDLVEVLRVRRVDERADRDRDIARADLLLVERIGTRAIDHFGHVVVLIDHLHGHEAFAGIGQRDRDRPRVEVEDCGGVERVPVQADDRLVVDRGRLSPVKEFPNGSVLDDVAHV